MVKKLSLKLKAVLLKFKKNKKGDVQSAVIDSMIDGVVDRLDEVAEKVDDAIENVVEVAKDEAEQVVKAAKNKPKKAPVPKKSGDSAPKPKGRPKKNPQ